MDDIPPRPPEAGELRDVLGRELRTVTVPDLAARASDGEDGPIGFIGHAALFNSSTWIGSKSWGFWEEIAPGAFAKTIQEADVRFLINHDRNLVLARNKADNLRLSEDDVGLAVDADMTPTTYARDLALSLDAGDVNQMSFAFRIIKETYEELADGNAKYTITEAELFDVSAVTYPAYTDTDASLRAFDLLTYSMGLDDTDRGRLISALERGEMDDQTTPILRAAVTALAGKAPTTEPASATRDEDSEPAEATRGQSIRMRHRLRAAGAAAGLNPI